MTVHGTIREGDIVDAHGEIHPIRPPGMEPMMPPAVPISSVSTQTYQAAPRCTSRSPADIKLLHSDISSCTPQPPPQSIVLKEAPLNIVLKEAPEQVPKAEPHIYTCQNCQTLNVGGVILVPKGSEKCEMISYWRYCLP